MGSGALRILMLTWHYPPAVGGTERMAQRLVDTLAPRGHHIEIWTARRSDAPALEQPVPTVTIRRFLYGVPFGPLFGVTAFLQAAWCLWRARRRFDVVHSHQASWSSLGGALARRMAGLPLLVMVASSGPLNDVVVMRRRKGGSLLVRLLRRADRFIALCRSARNEMAGCGIPADRILIVHNGLDLAAFRDEGEMGPEVGSEEGPSPSAGHPTVVYVGRLHPIKGVDILLRAFADVLRTVPAARLVIVGDGQARPDLETLARDLGLTVTASPGPPNLRVPPSSPGFPAPPISPASDATAPASHAQVLFAGAHTDPRPFYRQADVVVLPSRTEGMSNVMIEAMACARPIVATAVGGNCDLLDPEDRRACAPPEVRAGVFAGANGILVPPEDPEALSRGILETLRNPALARSRAASARRYAEAHCAIEAVADRYEEIYREMIGNAFREEAGTGP